MKKLLSLLLLVLAGCVAPKVASVSPNDKSVTVDTVQTNEVYKGHWFVLPAGVYKPDFRTGEGIYYRAPSRLLVKILTPTSPKDEKPLPDVFRVENGGLFLPDAGSREKVSAWIDGRRQNGNWPTEPTKLYPLAGKFEYR